MRSAICHSCLLTFVLSHAKWRRITDWQRMISIQVIHLWDKILGYWQIKVSIRDLTSKGNHEISIFTKSPPTRLNLDCCLCFHLIRFYKNVLYSIHRNLSADKRLHKNNVKNVPCISKWSFKSSPWCLNLCCTNFLLFLLKNFYLSRC